MFRERYQYNEQNQQYKVHVAWIGRRIHLQEQLIRKNIPHSSLKGAVM